MKSYFAINIFITVMLLAGCSEPQRAEIEPSPLSSQPVSFQEPVTQPEPPKTDEAVPTPRTWEQVSRLQRVLGTITDIQISDGNVQFIDVKVKQNLNPVNNPVSYDYIGQTLHLIIDEPLSAAGNLQNKLKKDGTFLVNFAQFSIPPKGEIVLASRFSYNYFFSEENGAFVDINGQVFDLKAEYEAAESTTVPTPKMDEKILYALDENQMDKPFTEIPYYRQGKSILLPEIVFMQYNEGHQPWLSNPVTVALVNCSNLISSEELAVLQNKATISEKKMVIDSDIIVSEVNSENKDIQVLMNKSGGIAYVITMYAPQGTDVLFVKQIVEKTLSK